MQINRTNSKINFGHFAFNDSGASNRKKGSSKVSLVSEDSKQIIGHSIGGVASPTGFKTSSDYTNGLAKRITDAYKDKDVFEKLSQLSEKDKTLNGVMIYVPGVTVDNKTSVIPNLQTKAGKPLENIEYGNIIEKLKTTLPKMGIKVSDNLKVVVTNDMIGAGSAIIKELKTNTDKIKDGYKAVFLMAGGGLGTGEIEIVGKNALIKNYEGGHTRIAGAGKSLQTLESYGASSTALIRNFAKALKFDDAKTNALISTGNAKLVTQYNINTNDINEIKALKKTRLFNQVAQNDGFYNFTLKGVDETAHQNACKRAINKFATALGVESANKIIEGTNNIILTGPLTNGLNATVSENQKLFGAKNLTELVQKKTNSFLDTAGKAMRDAYHFSYIDTVHIKNNTQGGITALAGALKKGRGNWLEIPLKMIK